jgi:hypothetical protein
MQLLGRPIHPNKTEKQTPNCTQTWSVEGMGWNAEPAPEKGDGAKN